MSEKRSKQPGLTVLKNQRNKRNGFSRLIPPQKPIDKARKISYAMSELFRKEKQ